MKFDFAAKGFLFTISVILFASTLVIFAQNYSQTNAASEYRVILSTKPLNSIALNDDISFNLMRILGISIDYNSLNNSFSVSGKVKPKNGIVNAIDDYKDLLNEYLFEVVADEQQIDFSNISNSSAIISFGDNLDLNYAYGSGVSLISNSSSLEQLDLNLSSSGALYNYEWVSLQSGLVPIQVSYFSDSNSFYLSESIDPSELSELKIVNSDGNITVLFGEISGSDSSISIESENENGFEYLINPIYSDSIIVPIKINANLVNSTSNSYYNSDLVIVR